MHPFASSSLMVMIAFKKVLFGRLAKKEASRFVFRTRYGVASVAWKPGFEPSRGGWIREINSWRKGKKERKRERREVEGDGGGGSSRLLRSSSASDDKSELRPRTRWHDGVVGPWTCKRDGRLWACSSGGALEGCLVSGGELYSATSLVPRRLIARNNRTKSRTNDNFHRECQRCGRREGQSGWEWWGGLVSETRNYNAPWRRSIANLCTIVIDYDERCSTKGGEDKRKTLYLAWFKRRGVKDNVESFSLHATLKEERVEEKLRLILRLETS